MGHIFRARLRTLPAVMAALMASCTGQEVFVIDQASEGAFLRIHSVSMSARDRAAIQDTLFPTADAASIGLFLEGTDYTGAQYQNIGCTKLAGSDSWTIPQTEL